jgi:hypothetical protein
MKVHEHKKIGGMEIGKNTRILGEDMLQFLFYHHKSNTIWETEPES